MLPTQRVNRPAPGPVNLTPGAIPAAWRTKFPGPQKSEFPQGVRGAAEYYRKKQEESRERQLSEIENLRQQLSGAPVQQGVQQQVLAGIQDPSAGYATAARAQTAKGVESLNLQARAGQQQLIERQSGMGITRSGLTGGKLDDLERNRRAGIAGLESDLSNRIGTREAGDRRAAIQQGMGFMGQQQQFGQGYLSQLGQVLGGTQYTPIPQPVGGAGMGMIGYTAAEVEVERVGRPGAAPVALPGGGQFPTYGEMDIDPATGQPYEEIPYYGPEIPGDIPSDVPAMPDMHNSSAYNPSPSQLPFQSTGEPAGAPQQTWQNEEEMFEMMESDELW